MPLLSKPDLFKAEQAGLLHVENRLDFSAFSLNLRLGKLYRRRETLAATLDEHQLTQEQFIQDVLEPVPCEQGVILEPSSFYLWQPREEVYLAEGFRGEVTSRSSWARLGVRSDASSDAYLSQENLEKRVRPLCTLCTSGTKVLIKEGDELAQLFVHSGGNYVDLDHTKDLIRRGEFVLRKGGKKLGLPDLSFRENLVLTLGSDLLVYRGGLLIPGKDNSDKFKKVILKSVEDYFLPQGTFFLSASAEEVEIPEAFVGYVTEGNSFQTNHRFMQSLDPQFGPLNFSAHPNAPYIGPKTVFKGRITFENRLRNDALLREGQKQSELILVPLSSPLYETQVSRYNDQKGATLSRL
jgi:deoxycytidine triphosphate deaminase